MGQNNQKKQERDIKAWEIVKLLAEKYNEPGHYVCATEVSNGTGSHARRWIDFVAVDCWPSSGLNIMGFEIKISKSDFRRELTDPSKHNIFFDEIDNYSIVAPDYVLDDQRIIPPKWGIYHVVRNDDGKLELKTVRKPLALHDEKDADRKIGRSFMASLVRAIDKQGATKARLIEERDKLEAKLRAQIEEKMAHGRVVADWEYEQFCRYRDICAKLDISSYGGLSDWEVKHFKKAQKIATEIGYVKSKTKALLDSTRYTYKCIEELIESIEKNGGDPSGTLKSVADKMEEAVEAGKKEPKVVTVTTNEGVL